MSLDHLHPKVRPLAELGNIERTKHIQSARWIGYDRANSILDKMEGLFTRTRVPRMPGMLLVGGTNNGKTGLLHRFRKLHKTVDDPAADHLEMPVLFIECPPGPDERRFYNAILDELGAPYKTREAPEEKHKQVKRLLETVGTRILLLDEIHNVLAGPTNRQRQFFNVIKHLCNDLCLPLVCAGTAEARNAVTTDRQLANRLVNTPLPRWDDGVEFWRLLTSFEQLLPLKRPSDLKSEALSSKIMTLSEGILGEAATILVEAACLAVKTGEERITLKVIRSLGFVRPSKRRLKDDDDDLGGVLDFPDADPD